MEYLIIAVAAVVAAWLFRNVLKDVFDVLKIFRRFGVYLWRLVTPGRVAQLGTKNRSARVQQIIQTAADNDVPGFQKLVDEANADEFAEYLHVGVGAIAETNAEQHPASVRAQILLGAYLVNTANEVRGSAIAEKTSRADLQGFSNLNEKALSLLGDLLTKVESDPELSSLRLAIYQLQLSAHRGAGDKVAAYTTHDGALALGAERLDVQVVMLNLISQRWLGAEGETLSLANEIQAINGHNPGILPAAHIEHWMDLEGSASEAYFEQPALVAQLEAAYEQLPQRVEPDQWVARHQQALALNAFALCFSLAERKALARKVFARIGDQYTSFPWRYLGTEPQKMFLKIHDSNL